VPVGRPAENAPPEGYSLDRATAWDWRRTANKRPAIATKLELPRLGARRYNPPPNCAKSSMRPLSITVLLLVGSNVFMTFAWYAHLKNISHKPLIVAILASWGIALFEYMLQVPANRIGFGQMTLPQLKMLQEVITLAVFVPFSIWYMHQPVRTDFLWAALCLCGAVYFMFRGTVG
jgi:hypothetical protein